MQGAAGFLSEVSDEWARLVSLVGDCGFEPQPEREPYEVLVRSVAHQQLHGRAAEAILKRFIDSYPGQLFPGPEQLLATDEQSLRDAGFSRNKVLAIRDIALKTCEGLVPKREQALLMDDEVLIRRLTTIRGVGRWTVEIFLMYNLGREDILPADDFGVREGWRLLVGDEKQLTAARLRKATKCLSPHRTAASWYLWRLAERKGF